MKSKQLYDHVLIAIDGFMEELIGQHEEVIYGVEVALCRCVKLEVFAYTAERVQWQCL